MTMGLAWRLKLWMAGAELPTDGCSLGSTLWLH